MKKILAITSALVLILTIFSSCTKNENIADATTSTTTLASEDTTQLMRDGFPATEVKLLTAKRVIETETHHDGSTDRKEFLEFSYVSDDGKVIQEKLRLRDDYSSQTYRISFSIGEENKISAIHPIRGFDNLEFIVTEEMYKQIFS